MAILKSTGQVTLTKTPNAVTAVLTNNPVSVYAQSNGTVTDYTKTSTGIYVYEGPNQLTYDATGTTKGTWRIGSVSATGITPGSVSNGGGYALTANHSAMTADNAQIVYTLVGLNSVGESFTLYITQNLSKTKTGANGQTTYTWIVYADTAAGDGISRTSLNKRYMGIAVNKTTATPSDNDLLNPAQFSWSPLYENIEVGGKNLIYYSDTLINSTTQKVAQYDLVEEWIPGREYTLSLYSTAKNLSLGIMRDESSSYTAAIPLLIYDTVKDRYTLTFTAPAPIAGDATRRKLGVFNLSFATNPNVNISRIQLEKGNVVTDWTPAVEDLQSKIINPNILKGSGDYSAFKSDLWAYDTEKAAKTLAQGSVSFKALNTTTTTYIELPIEGPTISNEAYTLSGKIEASTVRTITIVGRDASNNVITLLSLPIQTANQRQLFSISFKTAYNLTKIGFTAGSIPVAENTLTIEWLKLEKGVFATPWVAHVNDGILWQNYTTTALNGKNHIFWQSTQPTYGMIEGDIWYNTAALNSGVGGGIYRYTSGTWQEYKLGSNAIAELAIQNAHIAQLDAAKIMAHTITAEKIQGGAITATEIKAGSLTANDIKAGILADVAGKNSINLTSGDFSLGNNALTYNAGTGALNITANSIKIGATSVATTVYADGKASTAEASAKTYADTKATDTLNAAKSDATAKASAAELAAKTYADTQLSEFSSMVLEDMESLQNQIDGSITTWFYAVPPTGSNQPAINWNTTDLKNNHLGDLYYDTNTGYSYRWQVVSNTYSWSRITDTDITKALSDAAAAQDTADSKRRVFVSQPTTPYEIGDLWAQGTTGELYRCKTTMLTGSFSLTHWEKATKYTDDTRAIAAENNAKTYVDAEVTVLEGAIALKASQTDVSNIKTRLATAEQKITPSAIVNTFTETFKTTDTSTIEKGIITLNKEGIEIGLSSSAVTTKMKNNGIYINTTDSSGDNVDLASFIDTGATIPQLKSEHIDADVINTLNESVTFKVDGANYRSINEVLSSLGQRKIIDSGVQIVINLTTSVTENVVLSNWSGAGELIINFSSAARLFGSIYSSGNSARIRIRGLNSTRGGIIKRTNSDQAILSAGDKYFEVNYMNVDNNGGDVAIRFQDGTYGYVANSDIANTNFCVSAYDAAQGYCIRNRGYANTNAYRVSSASIFARDTVPNCTGAVELVYGHYFPSGTITKTASSFTPPVLTLTTFTQTFKPIKLHTTGHDSSTISTYYGSTAVQGKWNTMSSYVDGHITFSKEIGEFLSGANSITSITLKLRRKNTSHGRYAAVKPDPYKVSVNGSTSLSSTFNSITWGTGATIGGWSGTQTLTSSYFSTGGNTVFTFYSSVLDDGYAIWDGAEIVATIKKYV